MEYKKEYRNIEFRVVYYINSNYPRTLAFSAQPYELLLEDGFSDKPDLYLVYGRVNDGERLEVGFKGFSFEMSQDLHSRLGLLYETVKIEFNKVIK